MKICVTTMGDDGLEERVAPHFGRAPTFTVVDSDTGEVNVVKNTGNHMGGSANPPDLVGSTGADVLLCVNLGRGAIGGLRVRGITVYTGASGTVKETMVMFESGELSPADENSACAGHHGAREGHTVCH
jgi:predicted Fe-Mo cluster-binding NifX family protein